MDGDVEEALRRLTNSSPHAPLRKEKEMPWSRRVVRKRERRAGKRGSSPSSGSGSVAVAAAAAMVSGDGEGECLPSASHHARRRLGTVLSERTEAL